MKKTLILIALFTVLVNCEIKPRQAEAQNNEQILSVKDEFYRGSRYYNYQYHEEERHGMTYGVWSLKNRVTSSQTGYTVAVVNLTKEELEVELLKLQIVELHNKQNNLEK